MEEKKVTTKLAAAESFGEAKKSDAALREEAVLEFWREKNIFEKSLKQTEGKKEFVFYDGPPTANGMPGMHHLIPQSFKDAIPRYKTMRGYHVRRKGGWDTHGLPVELLVEKELGLKSKKEIESYGIAEFNQKCRESVWKYVDVWYKFRDRVGYWVDKHNPYVTYHNDYIESLWSVVKKVDDQKLLYKDYKVVPWCPRCGTALSSHELAQGYEDVKDLSVYAKFKSKKDPDTYYLAWTTTPWTLPGNVALAVREDIDYVKIKVLPMADFDNGEGFPIYKEEFLILAKSRLEIISNPYEIVGEYKGKAFLGDKYEPLYPYLVNFLPEKQKIENAYKIISAEFVNTEDGTGIVHTAVMYGQEDFELADKNYLPKVHLVDETGHFIKGTGFLEGRFVREVNPDGKPTLAVDIIEDLKKRNLFFKQENYKHSYPHCWRCKTALIYYARDSWYIRMSDPKIKKELIDQNKEINWEPEHIRDGRFGEWLREIKDWAISRERYWGTPLPVWIAPDGEKIVVDSLDTLKKYSKKSSNKYFVLRHGGTEGNAKGIISFKNQANDNLTQKGEKQVEETGKSLKDKNIDYIVYSNFTRTKETAEILRKVLGLGEDRMQEETRIREMDPGEFDGKSWEEYHQHVLDTGDGWFERRITGGESLEDVKRRTAEALYSLEEKYKNKNIVLVTHGSPAWLLFVNSGLFEPDDKEYKPENTHVFVEEFKKFENAEVRELPFVPIPHDDDFSLDLHRPYIDNVVLEKDGKEFSRTREVMDVWFDSGAMPFAQDHYPFENKKWVEGEGYPADYISEAIDQTRGWFYTLHAVGALMDRGKAYKNVICLGHLLDAKGKKMSKSVGNVVDPWEMIEKYGVDTLRLWMYSVNQPGESKNFDEKTIVLLHQQVFGLLYNVLAFYELYRDKSLEGNNQPNGPRSKNILDIWILAKLDELIKLSIESLDSYKLLEPVRGVRDFIGDLSTWYLRRSRERIKGGDKEAKATLYFVLKTLAKVLAPFAPFTAEDIWLKLKNENDLESVHLESWPTKTLVRKIRLAFKASKTKRIVIKMTKAREIVSVGLKERQIRNLPVKQPLQRIRTTISFPVSFRLIIGEELNVKEVTQDKNLKTELALDTNITPELKQEGDYRELVRALQDMRKKLGLKPSDAIKITLSTSDDGKKLVEKFKDDLQRTVLVSKIEFRPARHADTSNAGGENDGVEIKISDLVFKVKIEK